MCFNIYFNENSEMFSPSYSHSYLSKCHSFFFFFANGRHNHTVWAEKSEKIYVTDSVLPDHSTNFHYLLLIIFFKIKYLLKLVAAILNPTGQIVGTVF